MQKIAKINVFLLFFFTSLRISAQAETIWEVSIKTKRFPITTGVLSGGTERRILPRYQSEWGNEKNKY